MKFLPSGMTGLRIGAMMFSAALVIFSLPSRAQSPALTYALADEQITLKNVNYEIQFSAVDGSILALIDMSTGQPISDGNAGGNLWTAALDDGKVIDSSAYAGNFTQTWDEASTTLTFEYTGDLAVSVTITAPSENDLKMQASLVNHSGVVVTDFHFPGRLKVAAADMQDALLPLMPGALINSAFFEANRSSINLYPGVMFADFLALRSARGKLALYSQYGEVVQPLLLGFEHAADDPDYTTITHKYQTWIEVDETWESPVVVISIGQDYPAAINGFRVNSEIDGYKSLADKLGDQAQTYFAAPMYKLDLAALRIPFADISGKIIDRLNVPGMVHLVAFQPRGHDKNYPDFIPPDTRWGTTEDFTSAVTAIHDNGSLAVPYTNFSWWDVGGPTLATLPADTPVINFVNIKDSHGLPGFETYGPNSGFVMNIHNTFVQDKISEQHDLFLNTVGVDGIFEDQWGARSAPYDFNPSGLDTFSPATSYFEGVLNHYRTHAGSNLMTEVGVDVLANEGIAFMGTNYLWDMLGYRSATAADTTYYPLAAMLLRDKVLLYQHNLAAETWTKNKDMLRWNLAQGYSLSNAFLDPNGGLNMDNPWLNLVGVFQKYALANYADELAVSYDDLGNGVTKTTFENYTVYANWNAEESYTLDGFTIPPGGVITQANDGSVRAGLFTAYNEQPLSDGEHYLVEVQSAQSIRIFQPVGEDTELLISNPATWETVTVTAYHYDGTPIDTVEAAVSENGISFTYQGNLNDKLVGYYEITPAT